MIGLAGSVVSKAQAQSAPAAPPVFSVSPLAHDFGTVGVGYTSPTLQTIVTNLTDAPLGPLSMAGGGVSAPFSGRTNCANATLPVGGSCAISYNFSPTGANAVSATSNFSINGEPYAVELSGSGGTQGLSVAPSAIDFGMVDVGHSSDEMSVTVTNLTAASFGPLSMAGGGVSAPFSGTTNCANTTLPVGGSCRISYSFSPTVEGAASATSSFTLDGEGYSVALSGTGVLEIFSDGFENGTTDAWSASVP